MSELYGGRITDSQMTILCGIIELLVSGDEMMMDKGFPQVSMHSFTVKSSNRYLETGFF